MDWRARRLPCLRKAKSAIWTGRHKSVLCEAIYKLFGRQKEVWSRVFGKACGGIFRGSMARLTDCAALGSLSYRGTRGDKTEEGIILEVASASSTPYACTSRSSFYSEQHGMQDKSFSCHPGGSQGRQHMSINFPHWPW